MSATIDVLPAVAGIRVVHVVEPPIALQAQQRPDWAGGSAYDDDLVIRHRVGDVDRTGLRTAFEIPPWSTYLTDDQDRTSILFHAGESADPLRLMRSVRPGYEYVLEYQFAPAASAPRRGGELATFAMALALRGRGLMAHGSAFVLPGGRAALCLGVSGAGKSTLAKMMLARGEVQVLNDDRQVVTSEATGLHVWSTPWPGSADIAFQGDAPLGAVVLIGRATRATMRAVSAREALGRLLATLALPHWGGGALDAALALVHRMITDVPVVELAYPLGPETPDWIVARLADLTSERFRD